jgi:hypothetical protein
MGKSEAIQRWTLSNPRAQRATVFETVSVPLGYPGFAEFHYLPIIILAYEKLSQLYVGGSLLFLGRESIGHDSGDLDIIANQNDSIE